MMSISRDSHRLLSTQRLASRSGLIIYLAQRVSLTVNCCLQDSIVSGWRWMVVRAQAIQCLQRAVAAVLNRLMDAWELLSTDVEPPEIESMSGRRVDHRRLPVAA